MLKAHSLGLVYFLYEQNCRLHLRCVLLFSLRSAIGWFLPGTITHEYHQNHSVFEQSFYFSGFKFDAFIIYSTTDEKWVKEKLLATLEKKHNIKCCIHYRDFLPGVPFVENMTQSVYDSRKTIAVVSKSFLSSNYCNHELNIALHRLVERGDDSVIVIKLDDVEDSKLPIELQFRSYIDFTKAHDKKAWEHKVVHSFGGERCLTPSRPNECSGHL